MPKMKPSKEAALKKAMIIALESSLGIITKATRQVGIGFDLHRRWELEDPEYAKQVQEVAFICVEFAETQLHQNIKNCDQRAIEYYLNAKGSVKGYHHPKSAHWLKQAAEAGLSENEDKDVTITVKYATD